jgi:hypothetical protein
MSTRRYPTAERYESIERDYYHRDGHHGSYDELDAEISTASGSTREYIRERERPAHRDWAREPEVVRDRELVVRRGERDRYRRDVERGHHDEDEVDVVTTTVRREKSREPPRERPREVVREIVREKREPSRERPREVIREVVREVRKPSPPPQPQREVVREIVREVRDDHHHRAPPRHRDDEIDVVVRSKERGGRRGRDSEEVDVRIARRDDYHHDWDHGRERDYDVVEDRETVRVRERSRSRHRGGRETEEEEIVLTRRRGSSDSPHRRTIEKEKIIIKKTKERSPSPPRVETLQIVKPPIVQEIHQEVITHHHHVDHGELIGLVEIKLTI